MHGSNINIQIVYTATTQTDFMGIVAKTVLPHFIAHRSILMFKDFIILKFQYSENLNKTYMKLINFKFYYKTAAIDVLM